MQRENLSYSIPSQNASNSYSHHTLEFREAAVSCYALKECSSINELAKFNIDINSFLHPEEFKNINSLQEKKLEIRETNLYEDFDYYLEIMNHNPILKDMVYHHVGITPSKSDLSDSDIHAICNEMAFKFKLYSPIELKNTNKRLFLISTRASYKSYYHILVAFIKRNWNLELANEPIFWERKSNVDCVWYAIADQAPIEL